LGFLLGRFDLVGHLTLKSTRRQSFNYDLPVVVDCSIVPIYDSVGSGADVINLARAGDARKRASASPTCHDVAGSALAGG